MSNDVAQCAVILEECQRASRFLLGDKYAARMAELGDPIRRVMKAKNCTVLEAVTDMVKACDMDGAESMLLFAAAVEILRAATPPAGEVKRS